MSDDVSRIAEWDLVESFVDRVKLGERRGWFRGKGRWWSRPAVFVYELGVLVRRGREVRSYGWDAIRTVQVEMRRKETIDGDLGSAYITDSFVGRWVFTDESQIRFTLYIPTARTLLRDYARSRIVRRSEISLVPELMLMVWEQVEPHQGAHILAALRDGIEIDLGALTIGPDGLRFDRELCPWTDIRLLSFSLQRYQRHRLREMLQIARRQAADVWLPAGMVANSSTLVALWDRGSIPPTAAE